MEGNKIIGSRSGDGGLEAPLFWPSAPKEVAERGLERPVIAVEVQFLLRGASASRWPPSPLVPAGAAAALALTLHLPVPSCRRPSPLGGFFPSCGRAPGWARPQKASGVGRRREAPRELPAAASFWAVLRWMGPEASAPARACGSMQQPHAYLDPCSLPTASCCCLGCLLRCPALRGHVADVRSLPTSKSQISLSRVRPLVVKRPRRKSLPALGGAVGPGTALRGQAVRVVSGDDPEMRRPSAAGLATLSVAASGRTRLSPKRVQVLLQVGCSSAPERFCLRS